MVASGQVITYRLASTVSQQRTPVIPEHCISDCGVDANARRASGKDQVLNSETAQDIIQFCLIEAAEPVLVKDNVPGLRSKLLDDVRVPRVANQQSSWPTIRSAARLADTEVEMTYAVDGVGISEV